MRPIAVVIAEASQPVTPPTSQLTAELLFHLLDQVRLSGQLAARIRHRDDCELLLPGAILERDQQAQPLILRARHTSDPPAACTCGLAALIARIHYLAN